MDQRIEIAREYAMGYLRTPYKWGGDDPEGFDCSGLIVEILQAVGKFPRNSDATAANLFARYQPCYEDDLGVLVYWQNNYFEIIHVEFCLGHGLAIGASGGGKSCTTIKKAMELNAFIKIRPWASRSNRAGFNDPFADWR